jgi:hypothetical protein
MGLFFPKPIRDQYRILFCKTYLTNKLKSFFGYIIDNLNLKRTAFGGLLALLLLFLSAYAENDRRGDEINGFSSQSVSSPSIFNDNHSYNGLLSILFFESSNSEEEVQEEDINDSFSSFPPGFSCNPSVANRTEEGENRLERSCLQRPPYYILYHSFKVFCA